MTITYTDKHCLDCGRTTTVASNEPPENQRCIRCWAAYLKEPDMTTDQLAYSIKNAAAQVNISERKLRDLIAAGHIATVTPPGTSHPKVTRAELESWLASGE